MSRRRRWCRCEGETRSARRAQEGTAGTHRGRVAEVDVALRFVERAVDFPKAAEEAIEADSTPRARFFVPGFPSGEGPASLSRRLDVGAGFEIVRGSERIVGALER